MALGQKLVEMTGVPAKILKMCADEFAKPLCDIHNQCLRTGYIPTTWKHAEIIPVP